ncbi:MAG: hypothetical protein JSR85_07750 [Proteobacteria bacterium]|nr:hypothetical protein [Pseudomonadota bacterium]
MISKIILYMLSILGVITFHTTNSLANQCPTPQQISALHTDPVIHNGAHHTLKLNDAVRFDINGQTMTFKVVDHTVKKHAAVGTSVHPTKIYVTPMSGKDKNICVVEIHKLNSTITVKLLNIK